MTKLKTLIAAVGLALAAGPALAVITWSPDGTSTVFEDDNLDGAYTVSKPTNDPSTWSLVAKNLATDPTLNIGDVLVSVFELPTASGVPILPQELTGISVIEVTGQIPGNPLGITFQPFQGGLNNAITSLYGGFTSIGATGATGAGAMIAMYLDDSPDLNISGGLIASSGLSCTTMARCLARPPMVPCGRSTALAATSTTTGRRFSTSGTYGNLNAVLDAPITTSIGNFNAGLDIMVNNTGRALQENAYASTESVDPTGFVDMLVSGPLKGGGVFPGRMSARSMRPWSPVALWPRRTSIWRRRLRRRPCTGDLGAVGCRLGGPWCRPSAQGVSPLPRSLAPRAVTMGAE